MFSQSMGPTSYIGVGLRANHFRDVLEQKTERLGWLEIHPENYFGGGKHLSLLEEIAVFYPLSFHAVGLSLGSDQPIHQPHLEKLKVLANRLQPFLISEHASWSASGNAHLNDLLPLPYTEETLQRLAEKISYVQDFLEREILIENPSTYVAFTADEMTEAAFLNKLVTQTGCHLLLDLNNIFVQSVNHQFDPYAYLKEINLHSVQEIHLAGHSKRVFERGHLLVDTHNQSICPEVWDLYSYVISKKGPCHTLIEWDADLPAFSELLNEGEKAALILEKAILNAA